MPATAVLRRCLSIPLACALAFAAGACGGDDDASPPATSDPPTTTAPSTTLSPTQEDEQALRQLTEDWFRVRQGLFVGTHDADEIGSFATGDYATSVEEGLEEFRSTGDRIEIGDATREVIEDVEIGEDVATITVCFFANDRRISSDGAVVDDRAGTSRSEFQAIRTADGWRISAQEVMDESEADECPAD